MNESSMFGLLVGRTTTSEYSLDQKRPEYELPLKTTEISKISLVDGIEGKVY